MTSRTEERLRDAATALGNTLQCEDIPPLRLPEAPGRSASARVQLVSAHQAAHRRWLTPLLAAAAVAAVIGLVLVVAHNLPDPPAPRGSAAAGLPRFLVATVDGQATVRSGVSGNVIAQIPRPNGIEAYAGVAAAAGNTTYFLAGAITRKSIPKIVFYRLVLGASGLPGKVHRLPGRPLAVPSPASDWRSGSTDLDFAVAPDGRKLAYASSRPLRHVSGPLNGPWTTILGSSDGIVVQDVTTGVRRTWSARASADAAVSQVSWGPAGQLGYAVILQNSGVSRHSVTHVPGSVVGAFMVLDTTAAGSDLFRDSRVVSYGSVSAHSQTRQFVVGGLISPDGRHVYAQIMRTQSPVHARRVAGQLRIAEVSAGTGRTIRLIPMARPLEFTMASIDGTGRYLLRSLFLVRPVPAGDSQLERVDLKTGRVTRLSYLLTRRTGSAFEAAW
jgi:hypothetical protein